MRVAVILGGRSAEREVSLQTGRNILEALALKGHEALPFDVTDDLAVRLSEAKPEVVFIALHGRFGEDGCIQGLLELLELPYVGSGVLASAIGMDKAMSRRLFALEGLPFPRQRVLSRAELDGSRAAEALAQELVDEFGVPLVVKPNSQGSTIGVTIVRDPNLVVNALKTACQLDSVVLAEEYVAGPEITVAVLGDNPPRALPVIEIVPKNPFYDYDAKYTPGMSEHLIPARLAPATASLAQEYAVRAFRALGCRHYARVDLLLNKRTGALVVLEVNTLPGMTATSLVPDAARAVGLDFPDLVELLVRMPLGDHV